MAPFFTPLLNYMESKKSNNEFQYTPARTSSDEGEGSQSSDGLLEKDTIRLPKKRSFLKRYTPLIVFHSVIFIIYLFFLYLVASLYASHERLNGAGLVFCTCFHPCCILARILILVAPAREAVLYEERPFTLGDRIQEKSEYSGKPSAELDLAWHNLLNGM